MSNNFVQRILWSAWGRLSLAALIAISGMFPVLQTMRVQASSDPVVFYVSVTGGVYGQDGQNWDTAFPGEKLQFAINNAPSGSQVWVASGTYYPKEDISGNEAPVDPRTKSFHLKNGVAVYGGFAGNETNLEDRDLTNGANATILSGDLGEPDSDGDNAYHVFYHPASLNLNETAVLDGVTITKGNANHASLGSIHSNGGGMYNDKSSPTLGNVTFSGNKAKTSGGGIYTQVGSLTLTSAMIHENTAAGRGGGIFGIDATLTLTDVTVSGNMAKYGGGGILIVEASTLLLTDATIVGNATESYSGGGISSEYSKVELSNVIISGNEAQGGGGFFLSNATEAVLTNVLISGNEAADGSGGGLNLLRASPVLTTVTISENTATASGGGIFSSYSDLTMKNVTINGNSSDVSGAGLFLQRAKTNPESTMLTNVLISGNKADGGGGGGLYIDQADPILTNVTISGNTAYTGGGIYGNNSTSSVRNSIIWGNTASDGQNLKANESNHTFSHSLIEGSGGSGDGWNAAHGTDGGGNIDTDPVFVDFQPVEDEPTSAGDYRLTEASPAVDAGDDSVYGVGATPDLSAVTTDLAGNPRKYYNAVDMGAYELLDEIAPAIIEFSPESGAEDVPVDSTLELNFSENVEAVQGKLIKVWKADDMLAASVDAADTIMDGSVVSFSLPSNLQHGTSYYVTMDEGAFIDRAGNGNEAISDKTTWTFSAVSATAVVLTATAGDRQVGLNWNAIPEAISYEVYQRPSGGAYGDSPIATVTNAVYQYTATGLTNGTTYYFKVRAMNAGEEITVSNEASATPKTAPGAPTNVTATAGNGQATITFTAPTDDGGSPITKYVVTASPGNITVEGTTSPITVTGLANGTSYTFTVKAINGAGPGASSAESNAVIPRSPSSGGGSSDDGGSGGDNSTPAQPTTPPDPATNNTGVEVLVNGKVENAGTATTSIRNGQTVTTITMDQTKLEDKLAAEGQGAVVTIPVNAKSDVVIGELNGQMVKTMEDKQAVLEIKTDRATYTLPARQINISAVSDQVGKSVALQDIKVKIEIAASTAEMVKVVENAAAKGTFTLVAPPLDFTVRATYGDNVIEVSKFNAYVERTIAIPDGADPSRITTGVVVEPDGTVRHVPTKVIQIDGKYYAQINSLTNSTYTVVWHPLEFGDIANHWAKDAVNDMGSRMVIEGTGNGLFHPDRDMTRAEFAAIIVRALGLKLENGGSVFPDVKESDWYSSAVRTAYAYDLVGGFDDGTFRPNDKVTREQAMVILSKSMSITGLKAKLPVHSADAALRPYTDAIEASGWAQSSIADCVQAGVVSGRSGTALAPKDYMTRAEIATIIQGLLQKSGLI